MTSQQIASISEKILAKFTETGSMRAAYDSVFGLGSYDEMAGHLYDQLRGKAEK